MHLSKFSALLALPLLAAAVPQAADGVAGGTPTTSSTAPTIAPSQCNTGPIQCCNSVEKASNPAVSTLLGLLGIVLGDVDALVGVTCSPITVIGGGSSGWYDPLPAFRVLTNFQLQLC